VHIVYEAMWTNFLSKFDVIRQIIDDGMLGRIHPVIADHGAHVTSERRIHDPAESPLHRSSVVTATLATTDEIRRQLRIVFPGDR